MPSKPEIKIHSEPDRTEGDVNLSPLRDEWQRSQVGSDARAILSRDGAVFVRQSLSTPCLTSLRAANGPYIEDADGRRYLDFHGNSAHHIGYGHPKVIEAIVSQLSTLPFSPRRFTNEPAVRLAERLASLAPHGLRKVLFAPGGSAAIGIALKLARLATGRFKTLAFRGSFHGASLEASAVGGEDLFRTGFGPLLPGCFHAAPPDARRCGSGCAGLCTMRCASAIEEILEREGDIAAIIAEPIRCTTVLVPPVGYWQRVREACDRHGTLLIFDEIPTALGRTGDMFASDTVGVVPDMLVLGKALGGAAMPIAAVLAKESLDCAPHKAVGHYTHEKSPVGAAAALATLDVIQEEKLPARSRRVGAMVVERLRKLAERLPLIGEVRGSGLLIGIELVMPDDPSTPHPHAAESVLYGCLTDGLSFKVSAGNVITLTPPLNIAEPLLWHAVEILEKNLNAAAHRTGCK
jgi:4-aminobutyrate aminotransferase